MVYIQKGTKLNTNREQFLCGFFLFLRMHQVGHLRCKRSLAPVSHRGYYRGKETMRHDKSNSFFTRRSDCETNRVEVHHIPWCNRLIPQQSGSSDIAIHSGKQSESADN